MAYANGAQVKIGGKDATVVEHGDCVVHVMSDIVNLQGLVAALQVAQPPAPAQ